MLKWDFTKLSTAKLETNEYTFDGGYQNISVKTDTAKIVFIPSEDDTTSVVCYEQSNRRHSVTVVDGALVIDLVDTRKWYDFLGISFSTPKITVTMPMAAYKSLAVQSSTGGVEIAKEFCFDDLSISQSTGDVKCHASVTNALKIKTTTGSIFVGGVTVGSMELAVTTGRVNVSDVTCDEEVSLQVSTGKANLSDIRCNALTTSGDTGDVKLENVIATGAISIRRSTGDVKFKGCDAAELCIKTSTGDVGGTLLTEKVFLAKTDTGEVRVPSSVTGGKCELITSTGDIQIEIVE